MSNDYPEEMLGIAVLFISGKPEEALARLWQWNDGKLSKEIRFCTPETLQFTQGKLSQNDKIKDLITQIQQARETPGK